MFELKVERSLKGYPCPFFGMSWNCLEGVCFTCSGRYLEEQREYLKQYFERNVPNETQQ